MSKYELVPIPGLELNREDYATNLQYVRNNARITQKQLSERSGVTLRMIQQYEINARNIDGAKIETLCDLATALNCKIIDLLENENIVEKVKKTT